jgi:hypothetical protein
MADPKYPLNPVTVHFEDTSLTVTQPVPVTAANPLPVTIAAAGPDVDVNLVGINGAAPVVGHGVAAAALRVELPTDGTGVIAGVTTVATVSAITAQPFPTPVSTAGIGVAPVVSSALETGHVIKNSPGNLYGFTVTTTTVAGYVQIFNATSVPAAGAVTPIDAYYVGAFGSVARTYSPPLVCSTGISIAFSASTTPFTKTDSATALISGQAV